MSRHVVLSLFLLALTAAGCSSVPEATVPEAVPADAVLARLETIRLPDAFSAEGTITVTAPTMDQSAGFEMIARGDDSVKMSIYGPFGITVGTALFTRDTFAAYNALNNTVYRGSPERQLRSLPFINTIPFEFFMGTLQGVHLPSRIRPYGAVRPDADGRVSFAAVNADSSVDSLRFDGSFGRIISCTRWSAGSVQQWSIQYRYTRNDAGAVIPQQVELFVPLRQTTLTIDYDAVADNAEAAQFTLPVPDDAETVTVQ
ncbi:MAG: DUF4292 domain-containing protein [Bacteroidetes bacterium]|nr:DUF4292 domain-containing protein [Bacteroidota bacterium]